MHRPACNQRKILLLPIRALSDDTILRSWNSSKKESHKKPSWGPNNASHSKNYPDSLDLLEHNTYDNIRSFSTQNICFVFRTWPYWVLEQLWQLDISLPANSVCYVCIMSRGSQAGCLQVWWRTHKLRALLLCVRDLVCKLWSFTCAAQSAPLSVVRSPNPVKDFGTYDYVLGRNR